MTPIERLQTALNGLGLKAVEARLESLLEQASKKEPSYADFLDELLSCEVDARRSRYLRARLQLAHLPFLKNFDQFDFGFQPSIDERQIQELRSLRFIHEASNVVFLGPPGVGKTHLSVALAEAAIQSGFGAYFMTAHDLVTDLGRAYREGRLDRRMRVYLAPKVLIIDEMGYLPLDLGDHLKTGHRGSLQNRPMELRQDQLTYTLSDRSLAMDFHNRMESNLY